MNEEKKEVNLPRPFTKKVGENMSVFSEIKLEDCSLESEMDRRIVSSNRLS